MSDYRIGLLAPFRELPGEIGDLVAQAHEHAVLWQVVTAAADSHAIDDLLDTGDDTVLRVGLDRLLRWRPTVVSFACTSASFVRGRAGAIAQVRVLEAVAGVPATSTSLAFVDALMSIDADAVSLVSPYPEPATRAFVDFLGEWGIAVRSSTWLDCPGGLDSEQLGNGEIERALGEVDASLPVLLPDTAVWGLELHRDLATTVDAPLLVANQVTLWQAFDLAGMSTDLDSFGVLKGRRGAGAALGSATPGSG